MARSGVSERVVFLRRRIASIEARDGAPNLPRRTGPTSTPGDPLQRVLENPAFVAFSEIIPLQPRDAAAAAGFACALALRAAALRAGAGLVWIAEDMAAREIGLPYGRGFEASGVDPGRLVLVRARRPREALWAMEEGLKTRGAAAVIAESWIAPGAYNLAASRRLLLAAQRGGGLGLLLLLRAAGEGARLSSAAPLRFEVAAAPFARAPAPAAGGRRLPLPGPLTWRLRIVKARAGLLGALGDFDPLRWRHIAFDYEKVVFRHAFPDAFSGCVPAATVDRPDSPVQERRESA